MLVDGRVEMQALAADGIWQAAEWTPGELLAHASGDERLFLGELFAMGILPGGSGMETGHWSRPGDQLTLTIDQIGETNHPIVTS